MKVNLALLADYANVTREGKLNVMGILHVVHATSFPAHVPTLMLILRFEIHSSEAGKPQQVGIRFADPDGAKIVELSGGITIAMQADLVTGYADHLVGFANLLLPKAGDYAFDIIVNGDRQVSVPLKVVALDVDTAVGQNRLPGV